MGPLIGLSGSIVLDELVVRAPAEPKAAKPNQPAPSWKPRPWAPPHRQRPQYADYACRRLDCRFIRTRVRLPASPPLAYEAHLCSVASGNGLAHAYAANASHSRFDSRHLHLLLMKRTCVRLLRETASRMPTQPMLRIRGSTPGISTFSAPSPPRGGALLFFKAAESTRSRLVATASQLLLNGHGNPHTKGIPETSRAPPGPR